MFREEVPEKARPAYGMGCGARKDLPAKEAEQTLSYFLTQCFSCFRSVRLEILDELVKAL